jgi:hypothetical protein
VTGKAGFAAVFDVHFRRALLVMRAGFARVKSDGFAGTTFILLAVTTVPVALVVGSDSWFNSDTLYSFSLRTVTIEGLFANHSGHWITIPLILHLALYKIFQLHSYYPYELLSVVSHAVIVGLIYIVMRRMLVRAWLAAAVAATMLFFGAGAFNIFNSFQISLNGSIVCGLAFLLLVEHDGPIDRRNLAGVGIAILGLMTSAMMGPMLLMVFAAILLRRGFFVAVAHLALPAAILVIWFVIYGTTQSEYRGTNIQTLEMIVRLTTETLGALGQGPVAGSVLGGVIVFGLWCALREAVRERSVASLVLPVALLVGWLSFSIAAALRAGNLSFDPDLPAASRYLHVGAALLLPLIAYGGYRLARIRSILTLVPVAALAAGLPGNFHAYLHANDEFPRYREIFLSVANSRLLDQTPGDKYPFGKLYLPVTVAWLRSARASSDIPNTEGISKEVQLFGDGLLAQHQDSSVKVR